MSGGDHCNTTTTATTTTTAATATVSATATATTTTFVARHLNVIIVKKLNSLKHLLRTTVAELHN